MATARFRVFAALASTFIALFASAESECGTVDVAVSTLPTLSADQLRRLAPELQRGGYVFYLRHAATRLDQEDSQPVVIGDCMTQHNLSEQGIHQARAVGATFRRLRIPVPHTFSSPFCRCLDTAALASFQAEISGDLYFAFGLSRFARMVKAAALLRMLGTKPATGANTVLVAHTANLEEAVHIWPKPDATAVLFRPDGTGGFEVIGRIPPEAWLSLGADERP